MDSELKIIDDIIVRYVCKEDTDYALMINGDWGSGKTYYLKNHLSLDLDKINYGLIYISLFGVTKISDIGEKMFLEIFPQLNNETYKTIGVFGKIILRNGLSFFGLKGVSDSQSIDLVKLAMKINNEDKVLVFDDLERLSPNLLIETMGFINQLVEHDKLKVIISTNEKEITDGDSLDQGLKKRYKKYTEKIVRNKIGFNLSIEAVGKEIMDKHELNTKAQKVILNAFWVANNRNLRILQFVSSIASDVIKSTEDISINEEYKDIIIQKSLKFIASVAIEMKEAVINEEDIGKLLSWSMTKPIDLSHLSAEDFVKASSGKNNENQEIERSPHEKYFSKYWTSQELMFFSSIARYLFTGYWDIGKFKSEVQELQKYLDSLKDDVKIQALNNLFNYPIIEDKELTTAVSTVIEYSKKGGYKLTEYIKIYQQISSLVKAGMIVQSKDELHEAIVEGINKCSMEKSVAYIEENIQLPKDSDEPLKEVYDLTIKRNSSIEKQELKIISEKHVKMIFDNPIKYRNEIIPDDSITLPPFYPAITPQDFLARYNGSSNKDKIDINNILRFRKDDRVRRNKEEKTWFVKLVEDIEKNREKEGNTISKENRSRLKFIIEDVIEYWENLGI